MLRLAQLVLHVSRRVENGRVDGLLDHCNEEDPGAASFLEAEVALRKVLGWDLHDLALNALLGRVHVETHPPRRVAVHAERHPAWLLSVHKSKCLHSGCLGNLCTSLG